MVEPWCVGLQDVRRGDVPVVGGKAANLGELIHAGFTVPEGFVVTTAAFRAGVGDASSRSEIEALEISGELENRIRQAYSDLSEGPVAVRSSATAEDLPGAAFAGQQDTYLDVDGGDAVVAAVRDCWASLYSERAMDYRGRLRMDPTSVAMGVVVQRMVPADAAGVMFTADPVTGARDRLVVNASRGPGEAVVSGQVTPDHFLVRADNHIIENLSGRAVSKATGDNDVQGTGEVTNQGCALSEAQVVELAVTGRRIAEHFGRPQDIEWAIRDGRLVILQSRAMTALPPAPVTLTRAQRVIGPVVLELLPRRPEPMELTASIGPILVKHLMDMAWELAGVSLDFAAILPTRDAIVQEFVPPRPRPTPHTPARVARSLVRGLMGSPGRWRSDARFVEYRRGAAELKDTDLAGLSWDQLVAFPERGRQLVDIMTELRVAYLPSALVALAGLRISLLLSRSRMTVRDVLAASTTMTRAANDELAAMAADASRTAELRDLIVAGDADQMEAAADTAPALASWWRRFESFLATYGHRETTSVLMLHDPSWGASPGTVLGLVKMLLDGEERPSTATAGAETSAPRPVGWQWFLMRRAAEGVALREDTHFEITRVLPVLRRTILEMGRRLVHAGELDEVEDVWMLTLEEVRAWSPGDGGANDDLRRIAGRRATAYAELASTPLIATTTLYPHRRGSASALVLGTGSGGGRVTGRVRIIGGPSEFGKLRAGEVLVCSATNPSWTPLFQRAAAVVVDHGGMTSHAAIVAREYGIPAIMGAATATSTLHDGQLVTVDGAVGEVTEGAPE